MFRILSYKIEDSVLEEKLIVVVLSFPTWTTILGLLVFVLKWFSKALQLEKGCFSLSFIEYIKHTA